MKFSKEIVEQFVSWIDIGDIEQFIETSSNLFQEEETNENFNIGSLATGVVIATTPNIKYAIY